MSEPSERDAAKLLRFTTRGIVPNDRVQLWEGHNARALIPLDIRTLDDRPMHAEETNLHLPSVRIASVYGTSQVVERSEGFIEDNPTGVIAIFFATEGDAFFFHRGGHISIKPGQAIVYDADRPFLRGFNHGFRELVLTVPKASYTGLVGGKGPELPAVFDFSPGGGQGEQTLARLIQATLADIANGRPQPLSRAGAGELALPSVEEEVLGLVQLVLGEARGAETGLIAAARNHIELNITDRGLGPAQVAAAVGISERQLGRIFAAADTTVGRYILGRRLELAHRALTSGDQDSVAVSEIGRRFGFASPSHFSRTFRERYQLTPLQSRKEAQRRRLQG